MFKHVLVAAAVAASLSGGVAVAKENNSSAAAAAPTAPESPKTRYCLKAEPVTGTMFQPTSCKTLAQWKALGIDPTKKN